MNENKFANKKTDAEWISALFTEDMTDRQKYNKLSTLFFMTNNSGYCDSMAGELASGNPSAQALWWQEVCQYKYAIERECERLKECLEHYDGEIDEEGRPHGKGIKYYLDGSRYEGEWKHGKKDGFGTDYREDGIKSYEGFWEDDYRCGRGVLIDYRGIKFEGVYKKRPPYGEFGLSNEEFSVMTFPGGEVVEGPLENKKYRCTYPNGDVFECDHFTIGRGNPIPRACYRGVYRYADGGTLSGRWDYGKHCDGDFEYTAPDGTKEIWSYKDNEVISKIPCQE